MSKAARNITALLIAAFLVLMMVLVATSMMREKSQLEGSLTHTLESAPHNLDHMVVAPMDVYGDKWQGIGFACPGMSEKDLTDSGLNPEDFKLDEGKIASGAQYAVALTQNDSHVEQLDPSKVDVCELITAQLQMMEKQGQKFSGGIPMMQGTQPLTFQRGEGHGWKLVG